MQIFDSSSIIYAWDNYPPKQFPPMWHWIGTLVQTQQLTLSQVAHKEVKDKYSDITDWLAKHEVEILDVTEKIFQEALIIKKLLGIQEDRYGGGVGENDILIIATAKAAQVELVADEAIQHKLPQNMKNYKIPAVCSLSQINVQCLSFLDVLRNSDEVFG